MSDELANLKAQIQRFPQEVTDRLRAVAGKYAQQAAAGSKQRLESVTTGHNKEGHRHTIDSIVVLDQPDRKQFLVTVDNPDNPMLGNWIEYGTRKMAARPFMRPTSDALTAAYQKDMTAAATQAATDLLT